MKHLLLSFLALLLTCTDAYAASDEQRGMYFDKKVYTPSKLPSFEEARNALPSPIWDENPEWVELYWKAWEIAFSNLQSPLRQRHHYPHSRRRHYNCRIHRALYARCKWCGAQGKQRNQQISINGYLIIQF